MPTLTIEENVKGLNWSLAKKELGFWLMFIPYRKFNMIANELFDLQLYG